MNPPLFQALATHNTENAKLLIQRGADINYRHANPPNIQPIHVVARMRSASIMELLLNNGNSNLISLSNNALSSISMT